ncbi:MAG: hypothetical protein ACRDZ5_08715 [Acidimicrobiales bacterium]
MDERGSPRGKGASRPPQVHFQPGLGAELRAELAPLFADEGIDLDDLDRFDPQSLQEALDRVSERANLARFTPVGRARSLAVSVLREAVEAFAAGEHEGARALVERVQPESSDGEEATVAACIGVTLGLLDDWISTDRGVAPAEIGECVDLGAVESDCEQVAAEIVSLARQGNAFSSLGSLVTGHGGENLLFGCVIALCAVARAWSLESDRSVARVLLTHVR